MAIRSVATTDTLNTLRTEFNNLAIDGGDLTTLNTTHKATLVGAINEAYGSTFSFILRDSTSSTQTISGNDVLNVVGDSNISVTVSATDLLNINLNSNITGISSINVTSDLTINNVSVATKPFAIAQAVALG